MEKVDQDETQSQQKTKSVNPILTATLPQLISFRNQLAERKVFLTSYYEEVAKTYFVNHPEANYANKNTNYQQ